MGKPLNLLQETGWGVPAIDGGPKSWGDLMTGFFLPPSVRAGKSVGFLWINGERPTTFEIAISGEAQASLRDVFSEMSVTVSGGGMIPLNKSSGDLSLVLSGDVAKNAIDTIGILPKPSGNVSKIQFDASTLQFQFGTSTLTGSCVDAMPFSVLQTGQISGQSRDDCSLSVSISGGFLGIIKDTINTIDVEFAAISYYTDETIVTRLTTNETLDSVNFEFTAIEYKTALGG